MFSIVGLSVFSQSNGSTGPQFPPFIGVPTVLQEYIQTSSLHNPQFFFDTISSRDNLQYPLICFTSRYLNSLFVDFI